MATGLPPRIVQQAAIACALFGDPLLQGPLAHPHFAGHIGNIGLAAGDAALDQDLHLIGQRGLRVRRWFFPCRMTRQ
jgi:hypothetical protein